MREGGVFFFFFFANEHRDPDLPFVDVGCRPTFSYCHLSFMLCLFLFLFVVKLSRKIRLD